ncbi:hypothetical protein BDN70DRAFT_664704 [Pholiota conissans]|uniref:DUF6534 domain-containing protein n=1 Tax=Pholiota conissans TaxID=109636 RepID=A0A9P5Z2V3_9AGAR|nr:hypothetical protein BDN70DRAFT_664704 [Pholiota conissans]
MSTPVPQSDFSRTAGPLLIAYMLNWGLYGVLSLQVYLYYLAFPRDRLGNKALVYGTYLLETAQVIIFTANGFQTFAVGFGNPQVLNGVQTFWFAAPMLTGIVAFIAQIFYAYRISVLSQKRHVAALVTLFSLTQLAASFAIGIQVKDAGLFSRLLKRRALITVGVWQGSSAACDILIAIAMTYYLKSRDSGIEETHALVTRIIRLTIETGTLTATIAVVSLMLGYLPGQPSYYRTTVSVLAKLYSNSMMVVLNSRMRVVSADSISMFHDVALPHSQGSNTLASANSQSRSALGITVTREEMAFRHPGYEKTTKSATSF